MDLTLIREDRGIAARKFEAYAEAARQRHDAETDAIRDGYAALAAGLPLLDVHDAIRAGGVDEKNLPRLAICRADARFCYYRKAWLSRGPGGRFGSNRAAVFATSQRALEQESMKHCRVEIPADLLPNPKSIWTAARAMVPLVPADLRPRASNGRLAGLAHFHVLWEADWERVPVDPVLLKHVGGALYSVHAEWDLTEIERAVMARRFTARSDGVTPQAPHARDLPGLGARGD